jgi:hypothetical protein
MEQSGVSTVPATDVWHLIISKWVVRRSTKIYTVPSQNPDLILKSPEHGD